MMAILPTEVQIHILRQVPGHRQRLGLRLVCKSWNEEICKILRKRCIVKLRTRWYRAAARYKCFNEFLVFLQNTEFPDLPLPWEEMQLLINDYKEPFLKYAEKNDVTLPRVTQLALLRDDYNSLGPGIEEKVWPMLRYSKDVETLILGDSNLWWAEAKFYDNLHFPSLETLRFSFSSYWDNYDTVTTYTIYFIKACPRLKYLLLYFDDHYIEPILEQCNLTALEHLTTDVESVALAALIPAKFPQLKSLDLVHVCELSSAEVLEIIRKFSHALECLQLPRDEAVNKTVTFDDVDVFPECPRLKALALYEYTVGSGLLDQLTKLEYMSVEYVRIDPGKCPEPITSLKSLRLRDVKCIGDSDGDFVNRLCQHFPALKSLDIRGLALNAFAEYLSLDTASTANVFVQELRVYASTEHERQNIRRILESPLLCSGLRKLDLIDPTDSCLQQPNPIFNPENFLELKSISFYWHECLIAADVITMFLGFPEVTINNCCNIWANREELDIFLAGRPNAKCGCRHSFQPYLSTLETSLESLHFYLRGHL